MRHLGSQPKEPEAGSAVLAERQRPDGAMALVVCDVLHLDGRSVMREACRDRRKRLENLVDGRQLPRIAGEHKRLLFSPPRAIAVWVAGSSYNETSRERGYVDMAGEPAPSLGSLPEPTDLLHGCYMERRA